MVEPAGSESLFQKLCTKQLSLNWDVLSNTQSLLFTGERVLLIRLQARQQLALEEVELYTDLDHKANTSETTMARTPYVTVRGSEPAPSPPPKETKMANEFERRPLTPQQQDKPPEAETKPPEDEEEKVEPVEPIKIEAEEINALLDVAIKTKDLPNLAALGQAAMVNLAIMAKEVQDELDKRAEERRKKDEEKAAKKEKKRLDRLKEVEDEKVLEEKKDRERREKEAKDREAARQKEPEHA